jgi:hypothetical protein
MHQSSSPQMVELWRYLLLLELEENLKDDDGEEQLTQTLEN